MSVVIEAATAFCAISDAICIISCFISSMACFFSSSASSLALFMMREASSFASSTILFWFFSAFCLASVRIASASLSMEGLKAEVQSRDASIVGRAFPMGAVPESAFRNLPLEWDAVSRWGSSGKCVPECAPRAGRRFPMGPKWKLRPGIRL